MTTGAGCTIDILDGECISDRRCLIGSLTVDVDAEQRHPCVSPVFSPQKLGKDSRNTFTAAT